MRIADLLALAPPLGFAAIEQQRADVVRELGAARARREALLLADDTDAAVAALDAAADRLHLTLERLEAAELQLRARLSRSGVHALRRACAAERNRKPA